MLVWRYSGMLQNEHHIGTEKTATNWPGSLTRMYPVRVDVDVRREKGPAPLLPYYHCVTASTLPHLGWVQTPRSPRRYRQDIVFLKRFRHFFNTIAGSPRSLTFGSMPVHGLITFDDGLRDGLHNAVDLALQSGLTVVLFICPAFISNTDLMFRHKASLLASALSDGTVHDVLSGRVADMLAERGIHGRGLRMQLLRVGYQQRSVLDEAAHMLGIDVLAYARRMRPYLEADDLRRFAQRGVFLGSHGLDHASVNGEKIYSSIEQVNESFECIAGIAQQQCRLFSYPFGDAGLSRSMIDRLIRDCRLDYSFGTAGWRPEHNPRHLQRLRMETPGSAKKILPREMIHNIAKFVLGRSIPRRRIEVSETGSSLHMAKDCGKTIRNGGCQ